MGSYVRIKRRVWHDEKIQGLPPEAKLLFMYLLTSPHGNALGCYVLRRGYALEDLGWDTATFDRCFQALLDARVIRYDPQNHLLLIPRYLVHNPILHRNQARAARSALDELPTSPLLADLLSAIEELGKDFLQELAEVLRQRLASASIQPTPNNSRKYSPNAPTIASSDDSSNDTANDRANTEYRIPNTENRIPKPPPQETLPPPSPEGGESVSSPPDSLLPASEEPDITPSARAAKSPASVSPKRTRRRRAPFAGYPAEFEAAWDAYPRHEAKRDAFEQWQRRLTEHLDDGTPITAELLKQAAQNYAEACKLRGTEPRYIMLGKTFFGPHHRFADFIRPVRDSPGPSPANSDESFLAALRRMRQQSRDDGGEADEPEAGKAVRDGAGDGHGR